MKHLKFFFIFAVLLTIGTTAYGQNVTVSPNTGSLIAALTYEGEVGFENGWSAMWRHEQLPLTLTVSDDPDLTDAGEIANPAGNLIEYQKNTTVGNKLVMAGGQPRDGFIVLSLPNGYRITGYKMVVLNNLNGATVSGMTAGSSNKTLYETGSDYDYSNPLAQTPQMGGTNSDTQEYVIERTSLTESDMGNHLYFRLVHDHNRYFLFTIKSFEVYFTAEGTFEADVKPDEIGQARSVVMAPFKTSKIDIGDLKLETKNGKTYFAYNYNNVRDLDAFNYIYQQNAVVDGVPTEGEEEKHIIPVYVDNKNLYAFSNDTYFVETPIQVHTQSGLEAPVGYRIVGARFNYLWGTATQGGTQTLTDHYYITATRDNQTYYLNDQLNFTTNRFAWSYDSSTKNLYTGTGNNIRYLSCTGSGDTRTLTTSSENGGYYNLIVFTRNNTTYVGWDNETANQRFYLRYYNVGWEDWSYVGWAARVTRNNTNNSARAVVADSHTITYPDFNPGTYTLNVYDKTGTTVEKTISVTEENAGGILELENLNNDAVKFQITGLGTGKQALVSITLELQALNPYIDKMDIVCHDPADQLKLTQTFTADDFTVSGGKFVFYIPSDYSNTDLTFTFSDLYSHYGDATYPGGSNDHFGRYSFVTSSYFEPINGNGNDGLYSTAYNADALATNKIFTSKAGNIRFKFNNAENLSNQGTGTGYLEEFPFSVAAYLASTDPDAATGTTPATGTFIDCVLNATSSKSDIYYVFTADETRYNIAPTKAWQHRSYAFYRMDIELQAKTYTPELTWTKIYDTDKTYYDNGKTNSQWGLKLQTKDGNNVVTGYLTVKEILDAINKRTANDTAAPAGTDQILYIDGSELYSIINSTETKTDENNQTTTTILDVAKLKENLGKNAIVFLPANTTSTLDNFAYKTSSGSFRAGKDIVLTDKQPFYSPYDIQVDGANMAKYERLVTNAKNGQVTAASIILPFQILVDDEGAHTNADGTKAFSLHQMQATECLSDEAPEGINVQSDATYAFFPKVDVVKTTVPNTPYVVKVLKQDVGANTSFVVTQKGTLIKASTGMAEDYTFTGDIVSEGTSRRGDNNTQHNPITYSFTSKGTYSGVTFKRESGVFYFANNKFLCSNDLDSAHPVVKGHPFRAFYTTGSTTNLLPSFEIYFGEGNGTPTGITDVTKRIDTGIKGGKGTITISSAIDNNVKIYNTSGMHFMNVNMQAGETKTVNIPAGIYVVNGVKIIVK